MLSFDKNQPEKLPAEFVFASDESLSQAYQPVGTGVPPASSDSEPNNKLIWVVVGLVVLILAVGGGYLYMNRTPAPRIQTSPPETTQAKGTLEDELNEVNVESEGSDFTEVDKDLQSL